MNINYGEGPVFSGIDFKECIANIKKLADSKKSPDDITTHQAAATNILNILHTIPGVLGIDQQVEETIKRPNSFELNDIIASVLLRQQNGGSLDFILTYRLSKGEKNILVFDRRAADHQQIKAGVMLASNGFPLNAWVYIGTNEGQSTHINLNSQGVVDGSYQQYGIQDGNQINVISLISQLTTPANLGNPIDVTKMFDQAKMGIPKKLTSAK